MSLVIFGQPGEGIIQTAYVVKDIRKAIDDWVRDLKVGPWFLIDRFRGEEAKYRGQPSHAESALAMSFAGHMNIELIQPLNDRPSVYHDTIHKRGYELAFFARVPSGGRVAYMDPNNGLPGMVELIELGAAFEPIFGRFYAATIGWDGKDPVRSFL